MTVDPVQLPEVLTHLEVYLRQFGIQREDERTDEKAFGNSLVTLSNESGLGVRFVRDRGQWFLELRTGRAQIWADPDVWKAVIEGTSAPVSPSPLDAQSEFVRDRIADVRARDEADDDLADQLEETRGARARARLGLA